MIRHEKSGRQKPGTGFSKEAATGLAPGGTNWQQPSLATENSLDGEPPGRGGSRGGFTLVELLVVMAIIVLLASFILPAVGPILRGSQLTQATQIVVDQLSLARQTALTKNRSVEVRFYQFGLAGAGSEQPANPSSGSYRAVQLFEITDAGPVAAGKVQRLPEQIVIDSGTTLSTLIVTSQDPSAAVPTYTAASSQNPPVPGVASYNSVAFRFRPDGSANFSQPAKAWFLTLRTLTDRASQPTNFATIQIDAFNGHLRTFRP